MSIQTHSPVPGAWHMLLRVERFLDAAQSAEPAFLARLRALVEVESPSDDKVCVDRANAFVADYAKTQGATVKRHKQRHFGDVLELRFGPARTKAPRTLLLGHLDTVWPLGTLAAMPWREAGGKLFGPGILDMKCGVLMALEAIRLVGERGPFAAHHAAAQ